MSSASKEKSKEKSFTIIGDSNIRRFNTQVNQRACQDLARSQVLSCSKSVLFKDTLEEVRAESDVCILSCITNFICDSAPGSTSVSVRIESVIEDFLKSLSASSYSQASLVLTSILMVFISLPTLA